MFARAHLLIDHRPQQTAEVCTERKCKHRRRVAIQSRDELVDFIDAFLDRTAAGITGLD
jgi:hypothetical protein